ncbi:hypothetical protein PROFUN_03117 [Planoprotostelium fungivorum]|uniref:Pyrroloquinoline quinone-dependent pyranose dehydrogenase beta-propeller domain-containing protein n=1 Tax=Planoprotostelium fungivorum TaxID=1890364 RepID=A0A2P6NQ98_9EUKA|nr:hypothetical protein PROFUN_03117 [Planoprotostelium fungivorum]
MATTVCIIQPEIITNKRKMGFTFYLLLVLSLCQLSGAISPNCTSNPLPSASYLDGYCGFYYFANFGKSAPNSAGQIVATPSSHLLAGLIRPRGIDVTPNGDLLVVDTDGGNIWVVWEEADGTVNSSVIATESTLNHACRYHKGYVFASSSTTVFRWNYNNRSALTNKVTVVQNMPPNGAHNTRTLEFDGNNNIFINIGSVNNTDSYIDPQRAKIVYTSLDQTFPIDYSSTKTVAYGTRNSCGLRFDSTGTLWGAENSLELDKTTLSASDYFNNPADRINRYTPDVVGRFMGYPFCFAEGWTIDGSDALTNDTGNVLGAGTMWQVPGAPAQYSTQWCRNTSNVSPPAFPVRGHEAPLDLIFNDGDSFPGISQTYFTSNHGANNRSIVVYARNSDGSANSSTSSMRRLAYSTSQWEVCPVAMVIAPCKAYGLCIFFTDDGNSNSNPGIMAVAYSAGSPQVSNPSYPSNSPSAKTSSTVNSATSASTSTGSSSTAAGTSTPSTSNGGSTMSSAWNVTPLLALTVFSLHADLDIPITRYLPKLKSALFADGPAVFGASFAGLTNSLLSATVCDGQIGYESTCNTYQVILYSVVNQTVVPPQTINITVTQTELHLTQHDLLQLLTLSVPDTQFSSGLQTGFTGGRTVNPNNTLVVTGEAHIQTFSFDMQPFGFAFTFAYQNVKYDTMPLICSSESAVVLVDRIQNRRISLLGERRYINTLRGRSCYFYFYINNVGTQSATVISRQTPPTLSVSTTGNYSATCQKYGNSYDNFALVKLVGPDATSLGGYIHGTIIPSQAASFDAAYSCGNSTSISLSIRVNGPYQPVSFNSSSNMNLPIGFYQVSLAENVIDHIYQSTATVGTERMVRQASHASSDHISSKAATFNYFGSVSNLVLDGTFLFIVPSTDVKPECRTITTASSTSVLSQRSAFVVQSPQEYCIRSDGIPSNSSNSVTLNSYNSNTLFYEDENTTLFTFTCSSDIFYVEFTGVTFMTVNFTLVPISGQGYHYDVDGLLILQYPPLTAPVNILSVQVDGYI